MGVRLKGRRKSVWSGGGSMFESPEGCMFEEFHLAEGLSLQLYVVKDVAER